MIRNQIDTNKKLQDPQASQYPTNRHRVRNIARFFVIDLLIAAILFSSFYIFEYGFPFSQKVLAVVADSESSQILLNLSAAAGSKAATASYEDTAAADGKGTEDAAGSQAEAGTKAAAETSAGNAAVSDNTYTSDNLQITVTKYSSGSGNSTITWYAADIKVTDLSLLSTCFANDTFGQGITDTVLNMASENGAVLAVNGDYYSEQKNNIVIRNGELYEEADTSLDMCVLYIDGTIVTYSPGEITASEAVANGAWQAWCFGPLLLADDGSTLSSFNTSSHVAEANPRTAIGYYEPGHYCLIVVDGRSPGYSTGMTLGELSQLFEDLGCTQAYNLDGGKSSVMVFNGSIVNQPADGGRTVSDAIIIG